MNVNSYWEKNKFNLPIATGLLIWTIVFLIMLFNSNFSSGSVTSTLIFSSLIVGVPTCIFEIVFVYIFKVVKMKPKSSYDIGNINDYISLQERFRSGDYEYETINSNEDIFRSYERGKKIVFTAISYEGELLKWFCIVLTIAGLIFASILVIIFGSLNIPLDILVYTFLLTFSLFAGFGALIYIPSFFRSKRLPRSFFILAPEGVVYRRILGGVVSYSWKELDLEVYSVTTTHSFGGFFKTEFPPTTELHIILPNGSRLKFIPSDYNLDEFLSLEAGKSVLFLIIMAFKFYSDASKRKL